jgi:hypothetical protein
MKRSLPEIRQAAQKPAFSNSFEALRIAVIQLKG